MARGRKKFIDMARKNVRPNSIARKAKFFIIKG
jgi:hypothetical protein